MLLLPYSVYPEAMLNQQFLVTDWHSLSLPHLFLSEYLFSLSLQVHETYKKYLQGVLKKEKTNYEYLCIAKAIRSVFNYYY